MKTLDAKGQKPNMPAWDSPEVKKSYYGLLEQMAFNRNNFLKAYCEPFAHPIQLPQKQA